VGKPFIYPLPNLVEVIDYAETETNGARLGRIC